LRSCMCLDGTQCRLGSPDAPDATRYGTWVQDAQDAQDAESRLGESGCNTTVYDAGHLFADVIWTSKASVLGVASCIRATHTGCLPSMLPKCRPFTPALS